MGSEFPEAEFIRRAFTLRQMDLPPHVFETKRSLLRWFALSFGLISERESRSKILDVLDALFFLQLSKKSNPTTNDLIVHLASSKKNVDEKILRYHLKRLTDLGLLERRKGCFCFAVDPVADRSDLVAGFRHSIGKPVQASLASIESALLKIGEKYKR